MTVYQLKYSITGLARYISHLDLAKVFERGMRRAEIPLAFSAGFNPHPKLSFGSALAVGVSSGGEYLEVQLKEFIPPELFMEKLNNNLPHGITVEKVMEVKEKGKALMAVINRAAYQAVYPLQGKEVAAEELAQAISDVLAKNELIVQRQTKKGLREVNIRPGIFTLTGKVEQGKITLYLLAATGSEMNVRPEEVIKSVLSQLNLSGEIKYAVIHREGLYAAKSNGQIIAPLEGYSQKTVE
jgi:radical SAM-linked protein